MSKKVFTAIDMLEQAAGLPTPEGYAVVTKEFVRWLIEELERLYTLEEAAAALAADIQSGLSAPGPNNPILRQFLENGSE